MMILIYLLCILCPPVGGLLLILWCIGKYSSKTGRQKYSTDTANYYRRRNWYFKKYYGF